MTPQEQEGFIPSLESGEPDFKCHVCGKDCDVAPDPPGKAVCQDHCEDHDYKYERGECGFFCVHCFKKAPDDLFDPD